MEESLHNDGLSGGPPKYFTFLETPSVLFVGSCVRGISRSPDDGASWQPVGDLSHVSVNTLALDNAGALLAATSVGLMRSDDDGSTWQQLDATPRYATLADGALGPPDVVTYRLLGLDGDRRLAGTEGHGVWLREDATWRPAGLDGAIVYALAETASGTLLAGTRGTGVHRSDDGGDTWTASGDGLPDSYVHCIVELSDRSILAGCGYGVCRSTDDGRSWQPYATDLHGHRIFSLVELADGRIAAGSYSHMWIGRDETWTPVDPGLTPDETWSVLYAVDGEIFAGSKRGLLRSTDRGATWRTATADTAVLGLARASDGAVLAAGNDGVRVGPDWSPVGELEHRAMTLLDVGTDVILAGTLSDGMYRYQHGTWGPVPGGPPHWQVYEILRSPTGRLLAGTGAIIGGEKAGGVFVCDDGGDTWVETLSGRSYYALAQSDDGTIYAGGRRCFISRSADDGDTWELLPLPLGQEAKMYSLFVDSSNRLFVGSGGQLLRSDDGGGSWTLLDDGIDGISIYGLDEHDGLLVAATTAGPFVSEDGGSTWRAGALE